MDMLQCKEELIVSMDAIEKSLEWMMDDIPLADPLLEKISLLHSDFIEFRLNASQLNSFIFSQIDDLKKEVKVYALKVEKLEFTKVEYDIRFASRDTIKTIMREMLKTFNGRTAAAFKDVVDVNFLSKRVRGIDTCISVGFFAAQKTNEQKQLECDAKNEIDIYLSWFYGATAIDRAQFVTVVKFYEQTGTLVHTGQNYKPQQLCDYLNVRPNRAEHECIIEALVSVVNVLLI